MLTTAQGGLMVLGQFDTLRGAEVLWANVEGRSNESTGRARPVTWSGDQPVVPRRGLAAADRAGDAQAVDIRSGWALTGSGFVGRGRSSCRVHGRP